jgi:hypothetical protein
MVAVVAWQGSIMLQRKQGLRTARSFTLVEMKQRNQELTDRNYRPDYAPSLFRRLLGDEDFALIQLQPGCTDEELKGTADLFPEAVVQRSMFSW